MKAHKVLLQGRAEMCAISEPRSDDGNAAFAWRAASGQRRWQTTIALHQVKVAASYQHVAALSSQVAAFVSALARAHDYKAASGRWRPSIDFARSVVRRTIRRTRTPYCAAIRSDLLRRQRAGAAGAVEMPKHLQRLKHQSASHIPNRYCHPRRSSTHPAIARRQHHQDMGRDLSGVAETVRHAARQLNASAGARCPLAVRPADDQLAVEHVDSSSSSACTCCGTCCRRRVVLSRTGHDRELLDRPERQAAAASGLQPTKFEFVIKNGQETWTDNPAHLASRRRRGDRIELRPVCPESGVRRGKAALSSGCKSHPATAPAGSNRSSYGGVAEAFG